MEKSVPTWVDKNLYPFQSRWLNVDDFNLHYIDEGKGDTLLFVHGTPEWSFGFRDLIKDLRENYRCIALDLLGFGLSDKPRDADYTCAAHAIRLKKFIEQAGLKNFSIVANDFGGGISMSYVLAYPENIRKIILFNTWMWSLINDKHYRGPSKIVNTWLGKFLYLNLNFPVNTVMPAAYANKQKLTRAVHEQYKKALPNAAARTGAYAFAKELMNASEWWEGLWQQMDNIRDKPVLLFWGLKDKFIPAYELDKWKSKLPHAQLVIFDDAGHFVQEEKADEMIAVMREFL
ncbi:MAG: alpha/beta fold hydrolase [Cyclobacteriaceae bacterium]|nr:alpha/beta fold hydrolase [Cyclobacteriaceae bacterium]